MSMPHRVITVVSVLCVAVPWCACVRFVRSPHPAPLSRCDLDDWSAWQGDMLTCWIDCLHDRCCRAVAIVECVKLTYPAHGVDFIKQDGEEMSAEECGQCSESTGGSMGLPFQLPFPPEATLTRLVAGIHPTTGKLVDLGVEYSDGTHSDHADWSAVLVTSCALGWNDRAQQITVYSGPGGTTGSGTSGQTWIVIYGIHVETSRGTCGLMGGEAGATRKEVVSGYMLRTVSGHRTGLGAIDQLHWTFDRDCHYMNM